MNVVFLERVMHDVGELASLPQISAKMLRVPCNERSSVDQLARVIRIMHQGESCG